MSRPGRAAALALLAALVASGPAGAQPVAPGAGRPLAVSLDGGPAPTPTRAARPDSTAALPDGWVARDKALHLGASFLLTLSAQYVLTDKASLSDGRALPLAAGSALALGLVKEVADARRPRSPHFCWRDLAADAAGVALAAAVVGL